MSAVCLLVGPKLWFKNSAGEWGGLVIKLRTMESEVLGLIYLR